MLQVARLGAQALGESAPLVRSFFERQLTPEGAGCDRDGRPDLYYTIFALAGMQADHRLQLSGRHQDFSRPLRASL